MDGEEVRKESYGRRRIREVQEAMCNTPPPLISEDDDLEVSTPEEVAQLNAWIEAENKVRSCAIEAGLQLRRSRSRNSERYHLVKVEYILREATLDEIMQIMQYFDSNNG